MKTMPKRCSLIFDDGWPHSSFLQISEIHTDQMSHLLHLSNQKLNRGCSYFIIFVISFNNYNNCSAIKMNYLPLSYMISANRLKLQNLEKWSCFKWKVWSETLFIFINLINTYQMWVKFYRVVSYPLRQK